jgi:hopene-associated glycosyltransferase HpnB
MVVICIAASSLLIWMYLLLGRGGFWRMTVDDPGPRPRVPDRRQVAVIVPARNEAAVVGRAVQSLLGQDFAGSLHIFLVDDHSADETTDMALRSVQNGASPERFTLLEARPLPAGWTGKLWAVSEGLEAAASLHPDYIWLSDADIAHEPEVLSGLLQRAETGNFDLVSLMVKLHCQSLAERMLIPAFVFFFFKLYPPAWVNRPEDRTAAAAGGCILIRPQALARMGGIAAIRKQLIDDCALARAIKKNGKVWLGLTTRSKGLREYQGFREIGHMIARTAFTQLHHSPWLLCAAIAGMALTYLAPVLLLSAGRWVATPAFAAWLLMAMAYRPILRFYGLSPFWALLLPVTAAFYLAATVYSAFAYWSGQGGWWKGRAQDITRARHPPASHDPS